MGEAKRRAIPSLRDWLATMVPSEDANARDAFAAYSDWVASMLEQRLPVDRREASMLRMVQTASLAIVEGCNNEVALGADVPTVSADMCRCLGVAFGYAMMSLEWKEDTAHRKFATPFTEQFRSGLAFAIDSCLAANEVPGPAI